jgi:catechol 2,3-dioxygenase-like lactoylglutathione lyase family enzyme
VANPFVHVELQTKELDKAKKFYQSLFDWKLEDMPMGNGMSYTGISVGEGTGGGMWTNPAAPNGFHWLAYVNVDNIDTTITRSSPCRTRQQDRDPRHGLVQRHQRPHRCHARSLAEQARHVDRPRTTTGVN